MTSESKESSATAPTLPNRFDFQSAQTRLYEFWEQNGWFHAEADESREPFTIVIPPPNVTGALHLGHALNNTLQDVLVRMKRMQGYNALWMPGTDHAGIATQAVVERRLREEENKTRHDLGRDALVDRIWSWKDQYEARILEQLKQMGCSCDWERTRFTLDETCARAVRTTFFDLFRQEKIYRGKRLVNWDTHLQTAVSDDEVFHAKVDGHFWHIRYEVLDAAPGEPSHVTIATTRPETLLGDTAVAVHPDPAGQLKKVEQQIEERLSKAPAKEQEDIQAQLDTVRARREAMLAQLEQLRDMANAGRTLRLPLLDREIPLITDEWAKPEMGSGCVKITPAHDPNDYEVGQRQSLPMINILNRDGTLNANAGPYSGLTIKEARRKVVEDLETAELLAEVEDREIDLAHSDRSKYPIEPYLAHQWFVRMDELAQSAMDAVTDERVRIVPTRYRKGYLDWLGEKRDWPVSRQLWWGHRIPIWSRTCADAAEAAELTRQLAAEPAVADGQLAFQVESADSGGESDGDQAGETVIHLCIADEGLNELETRWESRGFQQVDDVLDTWFSSALWPHSTLGWPERTPELEHFYPTSVLITSRDIITLWVARMVLTGLNNMGEVPFRQVFIHPKILDGYGETMSKSKGNGVDPLDVVEKFGADALRFGLAQLTTETQDVRMPVQFECPHCAAAINQTKKNRVLQVVECPECHKEFATQWATPEQQQEHPRGAVLSERFELARNFCNKLWNAARFTLLNLDGYTPGTVAESELAFEDRWLLSRLATVTTQVTDALKLYRYSEAARALYDFAWDDFCSFYVEMTKQRMQDPAARPVAQRVVAYALDNLLRLLHPFVPFITEEIWQLLGEAAPQRGITELETPAESIMIASWPAADAERQDATIEQQFSRFQAVLGALREIRSRQNIPPRQPIEFYLRCGDQDATLLRPMSDYFSSMAQATGRAWGEDVEPPTPNATIGLEGLEVYVDLKEFIDIDAEIARNEKQESRLLGQITGKEKKLANQGFVDRAPADVVQRERDGLEQLKVQLATVREALEQLRNS